jgi:hypothetical protein
MYQWEYIIQQNEDKCHDTSSRGTVLHIKTMKNCYASNNPLWENWFPKVQSFNISHKLLDVLNELWMLKKYM